MRILFLLMVFFCGSHCFSQQSPYVEKIDGTKLTATNVRIDGLHKKAIYRVTGEEKDRKTKFAELKTISFGDYTFRVYKIGKKFEGFYTLSETDAKILGFREFIRTFTHGGFESYVRHVDVAIFDKQNNLLERFDLRENDSEKSLEIKQKAFEAIRTHFADCPKLLEALNENYRPEVKKKAAIPSIFDRLTHTIDCN